MRYSTALLTLKLEAQYPYSFSIILNQLTISEISRNSLFGLLLARNVILHHKSARNAALLVVRLFGKNKCQYKPLFCRIICTF